MCNMLSRLSRDAKLHTIINNVAANKVIFWTYKIIWRNEFQKLFTNSVTYISVTNHIFCYVENDVYAFVSHAIDMLMRMDSMMHKQS